jgi:AraC-like DNA-binding protein
VVETTIRPAGVETIVHASDAGSWTLWRRLPAPALRGWLVEYQGYVERGGRPVRRRELPSPVIPLILNLGEPFISHDIDRPERVRWLRQSFTAGLHQRYALVGSTGSADCLQVDMTPLAARRLFGLPMRELTDAIVELDDLPLGWLRELTGRLADIADWPGRFALLDTVLLERLLAAPPPPRRVTLAWQLLAQSRGTVPIARLAGALEISRGQLNRLFLDGVGLPAKTAARLFRFTAAIEAMQGGERLADVAAGAGYYDQPHFNRECLAFAGESPTALARRVLADGTGVIDGPL